MTPDQIIGYYVGRLRAAGAHNVGEYETRLRQNAGNVPHFNYLQVVCPASHCPLQNRKRGRQRNASRTGSTTAATASSTPVDLVRAQTNGSQMLRPLQHGLVLDH